MGLRRIGAVPDLREGDGLFAQPVRLLNQFWRRTDPMRSAVDLAETGSPPGWLSTTIFNRVVEVDLSVDAWPVADARDSGKPLPPVTDEDLELLGGFARLRSLDLHGRPVSDAGIKHLVRLRYLSKLNLTDTQVSDVAVNEIQSVLPECRIER